MVQVGILFIWGALNGFGLIVSKFWKKISPYRNSKWLITHAWKVFLTFNFITFTRVFFRAGSNLHHNPKEANDIALELCKEYAGKDWDRYGLIHLREVPLFFIKWYLYLCL